MSFTGVSFVGDGRSSRSASAITGVAVSGYHLLVIDGYSRTKQDTPNGECIESRPFRIGGYNWTIEYYPNGKDPEDAESISLFLALDAAAVVEPVKAHYQFSFVDEVDEQGPTAVRAADRAYRFLSDDCWGHDSFITREDLEGS